MGTKAFDREGKAALTTEDEALSSSITYPSLVGSLHASLPFFLDFLS